jgi:hypothetical protein
MSCVFHNAQWYWSDNLCKLVTDHTNILLKVQYFPSWDIWCDTYVDVIEEWRRRYGKGHLEIRKDENKRHKYI